MKIIVTGATGLVGAEVVRQAILDKDITEITALVRKPMGIQHPKLKTLLHSDFLNYSSITEELKKYDACLWCLGISQSQVNKTEYEVITYDYTIAAAKAIQTANPDAILLFLSGMGADSTEKSRTLFARVKGKTENALLKMGFKKLFIVRPGGIQPITKNPNTSFVNKLFIPLFPLFKLLMPKSVITSVELAKVMLHIAKKGSDKQLMENTDLQGIYKTLKS